MSKEHGVEVDGIVSARDNQPYLRLFADGEQVGQLTMAQARDFARNIEVQCARIEADAMILKFFKKSDFPDGAAAALMLEFRNFRIMLDTETVHRTMISPDRPGAGKTETKL